MTEITKTNARDERKQISEAISALESSLASLETDLLSRIQTLEDGMNGKPPTELKGVPTTLPTDNFPDADFDHVETATASSSTYDQWTTVLEETAAEGVIELLTIHQTDNAANLNAQARLTIDGTVVWTSATNYWSADSATYLGAILVGVYSSAGMSLGAVPFSSSFKLEFKITENVAGTVDMAAHHKYHLTG